jgi:nicotinate-nucleotide adenylyltransferase
MARDAVETLALDGLIFVPSDTPPHKDKNDLADSKHRLAMLRLAVDGTPDFEVNEMELQRDGTSYTIDSILELRAQDPARDWIFIIGSDSLFELHTWRRIDELLTLCTIVAMARPGFDARGVDSAVLNLDESWSRRLLDSVITGHRIEISASDIRQRVATGKSIRYLVPEAVAEYIDEHRLYGSNSG